MDACDYSVHGAGTVETKAHPAGPNQDVTFIEVWDNGSHQHQWKYEVSPNGAIVSHSQSGDTVPGTS